MPRVLFVLSSVEKNLLGGEIGWYLPEAAHPYYVLKDHAEIDFAAPKGPNPPIDPLSVKNFTDAQSTAFLQDETVKQKLAAATPLRDVRAKDYDAIFYVGGHGPVIDLATDPVNIALAEKFLHSGKIVSAVCHGPAALVGVKDANGDSIFKDKEATAFTTEEETLINSVKTIPFLPEEKIKELGGKFQRAENWASKVVVDGKLITGQNPASATAVGEAILKALQA